MELSSRTGLQNGKTIKIAYFICSGLLLLYALKSLIIDKDFFQLWHIYLTGLGLLTFLAFILYGIFPTTYSVNLIDDEIEIRKGDLMDRIHISKIKTILPSTSYINNLGYYKTKYRIEFFKPNKFGKHIHFECIPSSVFNNSSGKDLGEIIKYRMIKLRKEKRN